MGDSGEGALLLELYSARGISNVDSICAKKSCKSWKGRDPLASQAVKRTGRDGYHAA